MEDLKIKRDEIKKQKLEELIKFQDSCLNDKPSAEDYINMMPCWKLDEDHMILLRQKASQEMFPMFFDDGFEAGVEIMGKQIKLLKEALEFYAEEMNYSVDDYQGISGEMRTRCVLYKDLEERNDVYRYAGKRAREVLKKLEEMAGGK